MTHASLFTGIGGFDFAAEMMGWTNLFQCEWDPFCNEVLSYRFPHTAKYKDIHEFRGEKWRGSVDVLSGGFPCFVAGTMVKTGCGYRPIESLSPMDMVLTHRGRYMPITHVMRKDSAPTISIKAQGIHAPIRTTREHPFLVRKSRVAPPRWTDARDMKKGDFIGYRCTDGFLQIGTPEFWYVVGRYLGDGWIQDQMRTSRIPKGKRGSRINSRNWKVIICTSKDDESSLLSRIIAAGFNPTVSRDRTTVKFIICSKALVLFLSSFGKYAHGKSLPGFCSLLTHDRQEQLFMGWADADGYIDRDGSIRVTTVSDGLAISMAEIARNVYRRAVNISRKTVHRECHIEGRLVNERPQFCVTVSTGKFSFYADGHVWCLVKQIIDDDIPHEVFNIAVHEDETYTVGGITVHNCQPYSNAGKRLGKADERHLWPQMLRAIREVRPRYVVGENVAGLLTWNGGVVIEEVLSDLEAEGYRTLPPLVIPAAGKGAPHRRDRVWIIAHADDGHAQRGPREGSRVRQSEDLQRADDNARGPSQNGFASDARSGRQRGPSERQDELAGGTEVERAGGTRTFTNPNGAGRTHGDGRTNAPTQGSLWGNETVNVPQQLPVTRNATDADLGKGIERRDAGQERGWQEQAEQAGMGARGGDAPDASGKQSERRGKPRDVAQESGSVEGEARKREWGWHSAFHRRAGCDWSDWPTQSPLCDGDDGVPSGLVRYTPAEAEALRKQALHAGGNAILPQIALEIFKAIEACEQ